MKLSVRNGVLYFGEEVCREVGVNSFMLLLRHSYNASSMSHVAMVDEMTRNGIRICRSWGMPGQAGTPTRTSGNWDQWGIPASVPSGNSYTDLSSAWYTKHRAVLDYCESKGLSVIVCMIYRMASLADLKGETLSVGFGSASSATRTFARTIFANYVNAMKDHPAIAAWEINNEWNGFSELGVIPSDGAGSERPANGAPTYSSPADVVPLKSFIETMSEIAAVIKAADPSRAVLSGNAGPWPSNGRSMHAYADFLRAINPDPIDTISFHLYGTPSNNIYCTDSMAGFSDIIQAAKQVGSATRKPAILGEFGILDTAGVEESKLTVDPVKSWGKLSEVMKSPDAPQLMLLWNYGIPTPGDHDGQSVWDINENNARAYQLAEIKSVQARRIPFIKTARRADLATPTKFLRLAGNSLLHRPLPIPFSGSWTLAFWARYSTARDVNFGRIISTTSAETTDGFAILDLQNDPNRHYAEPYLRVFTASGGLSVSGAMPHMKVGKWQHYGYLFDTTIMRYRPIYNGYMSRSYYPNGETAYPGSWVAPTGDLVVGGSYTKNSQTWKGDIAQLVMVPRLCTQGEMYEISRGKLPSDAILLLDDGIDGWTQFGFPLWESEPQRQMKVA